MLVGIVLGILRVPLGGAAAKRFHESRRTEELINDVREGLLLDCPLCQVVILGQSLHVKEALQPSHLVLVLLHLLVCSEV